MKSSKDQVRSATKPLNNMQLHETLDVLYYSGKRAFCSSFLKDILMHSRVLFLLKFRDEYGPCTYTYGHGLSSGLYNSATFVYNMLKDAGIETKLVQVVDNNAIDREVHAFLPTLVVIEALWVVPEKFPVLIALHPNVSWVVRCHSEIPFLANESVGLSWFIRYLQYPNVSIAGNSETSVADLRGIIASAYPDWTEDQVNARVIYLPNYYPIDDVDVDLRSKKIDEFLDVACFGSIRPMKNQLIQAVASIEVARQMGKTLRFPINGTRVEHGGDSALKNLQSVLTLTGNQLVQHPWSNHDDFVDLLSTMDIGMQVSFSETFNIVAADMVAAGLPIVVSPEIAWSSKWSQADPTDAKDIKSVMLRVIGTLEKFIKALNVHALRDFVHKSKQLWLQEIRRTRF